MAERAVKYRLYPTTGQIVMFNRTFGCCRKIWNLMLADKLDGYEKTGKFAYVTPARYKKDYPFLGEVDSLALANVQKHLEAAFSSHFSKTRRKKTGFPKFKSAKKSRKSYTTNNQNGTVGIVDGRYIKLPKIGLVKAVIHRLPEDNWKLKSATVSREPDGSYYVSVMFKFDAPGFDYEIDESKSIGLDYASDCLFVDNDGNKGSNHKYFRESQKKLVKEQRRLSRMQGSRKGEAKSNNYLKQQIKVNRIQRHAANQRRDSLHKLSTEIANQYDIVCIETLNMKAMSNRKFRNGKSTMDNGFGMFVAMLAYKLAERHKILVKVSKWYPSSQLCSKCGFQNREVRNLKIRAWDCPSCGVHHNRDVNAACNILHEGLRLLAEAE